MDTKTCTLEFANEAEREMFCAIAFGGMLRLADVPIPVTISEIFISDWSKHLNSPADLRSVMRKLTDVLCASPVHDKTQIKILADEQGISIPDDILNDLMSRAVDRVTSALNDAPVHKNIS